MTKRLCIWILLSFFWVLLAFVLSISTSAAQTQPASGPPGGMGKSGPAEVGVVPLETSNVPVTIRVPGRAVAFEEVEIRPRVDGVISEIVYEPGRKVETGNVLFRIDGDTYEADVAAAEAEVTRATTALTAAEATYARSKNLQGTGVTQEQVESAEVTVLQSQADLRSAQAALKVAELNLERTEITSPITGIAETAAVSVGAVVTANQTDALTTVTRIDPIFVDVEESSRRIELIRNRIEAGTIQAGAGFNIRLQSESGGYYEGKGVMVSPGTRVSTTTGTTEFRIRFDNPNRRVLPGQFLRVEITLGETQAILVPQGATSRETDGTLTAYVVVDGVAEQRVLTEHGSYQNAWIISEGVEAGETLIVDGLTNLQPGTEVTTVPVTIQDNGVVKRTDGDSDAFEKPEIPTGGMPSGGGMPEAKTGSEDAPSENKTPDANSETGGN